MTSVLDAWAILAVFRGEPAGPRVKEMLASEETLMSSVNLGEVLYWTIRSHGRDRAEAMIQDVRKLTIVEDPDWPLVRAAARIKVAGGLSYADAFCVATAERHHAPLYTGDPEILESESNVELVDLRDDGAESSDAGSSPASTEQDRAESRP